MLIVAGAGTGKTTTLAHRIAQLVLDGADPRRILLLTFSRRASQEMIRRAQRVSRGADLPWAGTFHAVGSRLLRMHALALGLDLVFGWDTYRDNRDHYAHVTYLATLLVGHGESVNVPLRLGIGGAIYDDGSFDNGTNLAVRAPLQIGLRFRRTPIELYGEVALKITFLDDHNNNDDIDLDGGIGFRVYF